MKYENHTVAITRCLKRTESKALIEGLRLIEAESNIEKKDTVIIIPNWVNDSKPKIKYGVVVGDNTLDSLIKWVKSINPKRVIVAAGSGGGNTKDVMETYGFDKIIEKNNIEFIDFNTGTYSLLELNNKIVPTIQINDILVEENIKIISFTQLKQHEEATMSASIKNMALSIPSTQEHGSPKKDKGIHEDLHTFIKSMAQKIKINISIISANPAMVGSGPTKGVPVHTGLVICGLDPVSTDTICARLLGLKPQAINYLYQLEKEKIGETNINKINRRGLVLEEAEKKFSELVYNKQISIDS